VTLSDHLDAVRRHQGLLTIGEVIDLARRGNIVYDPCSTLIAVRAVIGSGNTFFPNVFLLCGEGGRLELGDGNVLHANTLIEATQGEVRIGSRNQFGEGGFTAKANRPGAFIRIGDGGRYLHGTAVFGQSELGSGSQLLGTISVDGCVLEPGGGFAEPDPDRRAGLLKGHGTARGLRVPRGQVIVGSGTFSMRDLLPQSRFHPKPG
jgi:hypothetical protein